MKLTVKTLKGGKFQVDVEETNSVAEVKGIIEKDKAELPAAGMKLIHSGKVLKDEDKISSCGIKPNDFLVVMVTKPKKPAAAPAPPPAATAASTTAAAPAPAASPASGSTAAGSTEASATTSTATTTPAPAAAAPSLAAPPAPSRPADDFPDSTVENLTAMGFPEAEVRHCLRAARGNPDIAVEFLTNGIPDSVQQATEAAATSSPAAGGSTSSGGSGQPLQALRNHPQFNDLRRLVQSNPQMLQQVLAQIGQQQPELLAEINANQPLFLQMMNEPVQPSSGGSGGGSSSSGGGSGSGSGASTSSPSQGAGAMGLPGGLGSPGQMAQMIQNMSAEEVGQMAAMMGISPDQLRQTAQMIGAMPPEQLNQYMMQAMGGGGMGDGADALAGLMGAGGGGGGQQVLRLSEEEMAAVDRLTEMGFDRSEAAQAFLACDKNEALAANLLMDSMGDGGGGFFGGGGGGGGGNDSGGGGGGDNSGSGDGSGNNNDGNGNNDNDEEMYD